MSRFTPLGGEPVIEDVRRRYEVEVFNVPHGTWDPIQPFNVWDEAVEFARNTNAAWRVVSVTERRRVLRDSSQPTEVQT